MSKQKQGLEREIWLDNLRIIAIVCVVLIHVSSNPNNLIPSTDAFLEIYKSSLRFSVPLFVMVSGTIQLNQSSSIFSFYKKRIPKIVLALLLWGNVYILFNHVFKSPYNLRGYLGSFLLSSTPGSVHLWFLYLIIGLYLITPLLWKVLSYISTKQLIFLSTLFAFLFFDITPLRILGFTQTTLIKISSYPNYLVLFIPYISYYILGKAIKDIKPKFNVLQVVFLVIILVSSLVYTSFFTAITNNEAFSSYTSINVYLSTICLFCLVYQLGEIPIIGNELNVKIATASFGIYLIHNLIRNTFTLFGISGFLISPAIGIPIFAGVVFVISYALTILLKSNRITKNLV